MYVFIFFLVSLDGGGGRFDDGREGGRGEKIVSMKERKLGRINCGEALLSLGELFP